MRLRSRRRVLQGALVRLIERGPQRCKIEAPFAISLRWVNLDRRLAAGRIDRHEPEIAGRRVQLEHQIVPSEPARNRDGEFIHHSNPPTQSTPRSDFPPVRGTPRTEN